MVFVEFVSSNYPYVGAKHHFIGASLGDVLAETDGGKEFGFAKFSSHRVTTEEEARNLGLGYLEQGIIAVLEGGCKSYKFCTPATVS